MISNYVSNDALSAFGLGYFDKVKHMLFFATLSCHAKYDVSR